MSAGEDQGNILVFKKDNKLPRIINSTELGEYFKNSNSNTYQDILNNLNSISTALDIKSLIGDGETFQIIAKNADLIAPGQDGLYPAVLRGKDGRIVEHIKLRKAGFDCMQAARVVGTQFMLLNIAMKLDAIDKKLDTINSNFHIDRIAKIKSGLSSLRTLHHYEQEIRDQEVSNTLQTLRDGMHAGIEELRFDISRWPDETTGFLDGWFGDGVKQAEQRIAKSRETLFYIAEALKGMLVCETLRSNPQILAMESHFKVFQDMLSDGILDIAIRKSRILPKSRTDINESFWNEAKIELLKPTAQLGFKMHESIAIEIHTKDLEVANHGK